MGSGIGGINTIETCHQVLLDRGPNKVSPFLFPPALSTWYPGTYPLCMGIEAQILPSQRRAPRERTTSVTRRE